MCRSQTRWSKVRTPLCQSSLKFLNENLLLARYVWCDFRANVKQGSLTINFYVFLLSKSNSESNRALRQFFSINDHLRSWRNLPHDQQRHHWTLQVCQLYKNFKIFILNKLNGCLFGFGVYSCAWNSLVL